MCVGGAGSLPLESYSDEELASYLAPVAQEVGLDENGNMTYSFGENYTYEQDTYDRAQAEIERRQQLRDQLAEQAAERQSIFTDQQRQAKEMQQQQDAEIVRQGGLQQQAAQDRLAQEQQIGRERVATQAVSQSMQVLGRAGKSGTAPTAQMARGQTRTRARGASGGQGLRIGSSAAAPGTGLNIGG